MTSRHDEAETRFGPIHAVVNIAGVMATRPALDQDERPWDSVLDTNLESNDVSLSQAVSDAATRLGLKTVLITHSSAMRRALRSAEIHGEWISDVVVFDAPDRPNTDGLRVHYVSSGWPLLDGMTELPRLLRAVGIEYRSTVWFAVNG